MYIDAFQFGIAIGAIGLLLLEFAALIAYAVTRRK